MSSYVPGSEDWRAYVERLDQYFVANVIIDGDRQRAVLLTVCGSGTYQLIRDLVSPAKPAEKTYAELVELVTKHYSPRPSVIMQRYKFNSRKRGIAESISDYVAALRQLSEFCEYGGTLDEMLRDRLVCGVNHEKLQQRLLSESDLTLAKCLQLARTWESTEKDIQQLKGPPESVMFHQKRVPTVEQVPAFPKKFDGPSSRPQKSVCYRCGGSNHWASTCRFIDVECRACRKRGHIARMCRSTPQEVSSERSQKLEKPRHRALYVDEAMEEPLLEDDPAYTMFTLRDPSSSTPFTTLVELCGQETCMEIDTGASQSIASEATYKDLVSKGCELPLEKVVSRLVTYTGECLPILGRVIVSVKVNHQEAKLPLLIIKGEGPSLIGRNWLAELRLDWNQVNHIEDSNEELKQLLSKHEALFRDELGTLKGTKAKIHIKEGAKPKFFKPRNVPYVLKEKLEAELERLQAQDIIRPVEFADWAAPVVPVVKQNGTIRVCGDYKLTINQASHTESYPLPRVEDIFSALGGGESFSKLDLSQAYLQLELEESSKKYLTINTHKGLFEYNRLPFGVSSAPAIFQRTMDSLLQGIPGASSYIDDIVVMGKTRAEHLQNLERVLTRLEQAGLRLNKSKCVFMAASIEYLGHVIDKDGLHPNLKKVEGIRKARAPTCVTELRSFLGMLNYYAKFLPGLSTKLAPLHFLLCKSVKWSWGKKQRDAFAHAQEQLQSDSLLVHYDPTKPLILACDASPYGVGAVLSHVMEDQTERPIGFASRTLTSAEKGYSQLDKEGLAILSGVKKFHSYLYGRPFVIRSDHQPLYHLFSEKKGIPPLASARLQRWALTLSAYQYTIEYKPGKLLANADALSRLPTPTTTSSVGVPGELTQLIHFLDSTPISSADVKEWTEKNHLLSRVKKFVMSGWPAATLDAEFQPYSSKQHELSVLEGCLLWGSRLVIPPQGRKPLLEQLHEAHLGVSRMKSLARGYVWWPDLNADVEQYVRRCAVCQASRPQPPVAPTHAWEVPKQPWNRLHVDFAGPFMGTMFLVLVDAFSKWVDVVMMSSITASATIEKLQQIFSTHGLPRTIVSDNGRSFVSEEFQSFCRVNGIRHVTSAPYHPATNGLAERAVQSFKQGLQRLQGGTLQSKLTRYLFHYRITPHTTTGLTPAEMLMGRRPRSLLDLLHPDSGERLESRRPPPVRLARSFEVNDKVFARDFRSRKVKWMPGEIVRVTGPLSYQVRVSCGLIRRHVDGLRQRYSEDTLADSLDELLEPEAGLSRDLPPDHVSPAPSAVLLDHSTEQPVVSVVQPTSPTEQPDPIAVPSTPSSSVVTDSPATVAPSSPVRLRPRTRASRTKVPSTPAIRHSTRGHVSPDYWRGTC